jgi:predicted transcriptional regulator
MTPEQCRAARAWLDWSQAELAKKAKVGLSTLIEFEHGCRDTRTAKRIAIQTALEKRGIRFLNAGALGIAFVKPSRKKRAK